MNVRPGYTVYHPQWLRHRVSTFWWMQRRSYFVFIMRELSSIFVAWFVVFLLLLVRAVSTGAATYQQFLDWSGSPIVLVVNLVSLFFIVFHAITWFNLAPKAMVAHVGGKRVPGFWIAASNYVGWIVASAVVIWILFEE